MHALLSEQSSSLVHQSLPSSPSHPHSSENPEFKDKILNYSQIIDQNFETRLKDLHEFISDLFQVDNSPLVYMSDSENPNSPSKSPNMDDLKQSISEVVSSLENRLREHYFYRLLTIAEINQCFRAIKLQIANMLNSRWKKTLSDRQADGPETERDGTQLKDFVRPSKSRLTFSKKAQTVLKAWLKQHMNDPYPNPQEKEDLAVEAGITPRQVQIWFSNKRTRMKNKKPKKASFSKQVQEQFLNKQDYK
jgi:hypothetical protein